MAELSTHQIGDGRRFIQAVDEAGVVSSAALWFWSTQANAWHYVLASPSVEPDKDMPVKIAAVLSLMPAGFAVNRDNLKLYPPDAPLVRSLQSLMQTGPGVSAIRMTGNVINGVRIEDAYVYRLNRRAG
ncbi:MAG: hypothetical protein ABI439_10190 [Rhodospirillales bacterium]